MTTLSTPMSTPSLAKERRGRILPEVPRSWAKNGWSVWHIIMSVVLVALGVWVMLDAWSDIYKIVYDDLASSQQENTQVILVPIVALWLVWVRRGRFRHCKPRGHWVGLLIMLAGWALYMIGDSYFVVTFWQAGAVAMAIGCLCTVLGKDVLFSYLPAFIVLCFLLPVPASVRQSIALPLQTASAASTRELCTLLGMTVEQAGNQLIVNGQPLLIVEACNGMRMVFALMLVSFVFAFGTPLRWYVRIAILVLSPVSAIFCNLVRLVPTTYFYGYHRHIAEAFHDYSGWFMLPIAFLLLMGIVSLLRWALLPIAKFTLAYD
jgi:exosortase